MDIQPATMDDSRAIVALFKRHDFALQSIDWLEWKYQANPAGRAHSFKVLSEDRIVGAVAMIPQRFNWRGREFIGLQAVDGLLGKELRGQGHFSRLMQFLAAQQPAGEPDNAFHLSFPSLPASIQAHESAGWDRLVSFNLSICMLTPSLPLEKAGVGLMRRVLALPWAAYRKWIMGPDNSSVQVREWAGEEVQLNALARGGRVVGDRSAAFMRWRVQDNPRDDIHLLLIDEREVRQGYAVVRISGCTTQVLELRLRQPRRRHLRALVRHIDGHHQSDAIAFWSLGQPRMQSLIRRMGFIRRQLSGECYVKHLQRAGLPADPEQWDLGFLDSDW